MVAHDAMLQDIPRVLPLIVPGSLPGRLTPSYPVLLFLSSDVDSEAPPARRRSAPHINPVLKAHQ